MSKTVCVTGASGYVGSWIVHRLLEKGYQVRAAVRDVAKADFLQKLAEGKKGNLKYVIIPDICHETGFPEAFQGCDYVIHSAASVSLDPGNEDAIIKTAVEGTKLVLDQVLKAGIKRLVFTATMASICGSQREKDPAHVWTENDWNDAPGTAYSKGKTLAEKAVWDFAKEHPNLEIVTIHPSLVVGPVLSSRFESSVSIALNLINGKSVQGAPLSKWGLVDVRDVADAHVAALEVPEAKGNRYIVSLKEQYTSLEFCQIAREVYPQLAPQIPTKFVGDGQLTSLKNSADNSKVLKLLHKSQLIEPKQSVLEMIQSAVSQGLLKP